jgi:hypothetical protein
MRIFDADRAEFNQRRELKSLPSLIPLKMVLYPLRNSSLHERERGLIEYYGHIRQFECLSCMGTDCRYSDISVRIVVSQLARHYACLPAMRVLADTSYPQTSYSTLTNAS